MNQSDMIRSVTNLLTPMENSQETWYIVRSVSRQCEILCQYIDESLDQDPLKDGLESSLEDSASSGDSSGENALKRWGPFKTQNQAIAKRVGLIRAGKCKPN